VQRRLPPYRDFISDGRAERVPLSRTLIEVLDVSKDATRRLTVVPAKLPGEPPLGRKRR